MTTCRRAFTKNSLLSDDRYLIQHRRRRRTEREVYLRVVSSVIGAVWRHVAAGVPGPGPWINRAALPGGLGAPATFTIVTCQDENQQKQYTWCVYKRRRLSTPTCSPTLRCVSCRLSPTHFPVLPVKDTTKPISKKMSHALSQIVYILLFSSNGLT